MTCSTEGQSRVRSRSGSSAERRSSRPAAMIAATSPASAAVSGVSRAHGVAPPGGVAPYRGRPKSVNIWSPSITAP